MTKILERNEVANKLTVIMSPAYMANGSFFFSPKKLPRASALFPSWISNC